MRQLLVGVAVALVLAAPASASGTKPAKGPNYGAQITALQKQVTTLKKQLLANTAFDICNDAQTQDTFILFGRIFDAMLGTTNFTNLHGPDDQGACAAIGVQRTPVYLRRDATAVTSAAGALRRYAIQVASLR
jgi:hypothetical protein